MAPLHQVIQTIFLPLITFNAPGVGGPFIIPPSPTRPVAGSNERERSTTLTSTGKLYLCNDPFVKPVYYFTHLFPCDTSHHNAPQTLILLCLIHNSVPAPHQYYPAVPLMHSCGTPPIQLRVPLCCGYSFWHAA
jgi:hypothetical protein